MKLLIKNGKIADFENNTFQEKDVLIIDGKISKIAKDIKANDSKIVDANGLYVLPGLIDMHAHLREPGREDEEDIKSGSLAAISGGFTTVCAMPNTDPVIDNAGLVKYVLEKGKAIGLIDVLPIGSITKGRCGKELSEMLKMKQAGCIAFSDDGSWVNDTLLMRRAMEYSLMLDALLILHCEDDLLSKGGVMNEGLLSMRLGLQGIPREAEIIAVRRDIELAKLTNARIHITHATTKEVVDIIKQAKEEGVKVSADTCAHYLILNEMEVLNYNTNAKVNPPLRTEADSSALIQGLCDGVIDSISTDHAPHSDEEKDCEFNSASFGIIGLETSLSLSLRLIEYGKIDLLSLIKKFTLNPAKLLKLKDRGQLKEELNADIIILDTNKKWNLTADGIISKSKNTPFLGQDLTAKVKACIKNGHVLYDDFKNKEMR